MAHRDELDDGANREDEGEKDDAPLAPHLVGQPPGRQGAQDAAQAEHGSDPALLVGHPLRVVLVAECRPVEEFAEALHLKGPARATAVPFATHSGRTLR